MNRLTKKSNSILKAIEYQLMDEKENLDANEGIKKIPVLATNKLGRLEDIEEELGIDLVALFKALKCGVCIKDEGYFNNTDIYFHPLEMEFVIEWANKDNMGYECLKDYGKTWALTKEELEID